MEVSKALVDKLSLLVRAELDEEGREINNPVPITVHCDEGVETLEAKIKRLMRVSLAREAMEQGMESFEEANDFDVEDPFDLAEVASEYTMEDEVPVMKEEVIPEKEEPKKEEAVVDPEKAEAKSEVIEKPSDTT